MQRALFADESWQETGAERQDGGQGQDLAIEGLAHAQRRAILQVGDDPDADVRAAQRVGLRGLLVLSGKTTAAQVEAGTLGRGRRQPEAIAASLADIVAALD